MAVWRGGKTPGLSRSVGGSTLGPCVDCTRAFPLDPVTFPLPLGAGCSPVAQGLLRVKGDNMSASTIPPEVRALAADLQQAKEAIDEQTARLLRILDLLEQVDVVQRRQPLRLVADEKGGD